MEREDIFYNNGEFAFLMTGTMDDIDEAAYLFEAIYQYISNRKEHGWTEDEISRCMKKVTSDAEGLSGNAAAILLKQDELFTPDAINKFYKKVLRGQGDIKYNVDEYLYNEEYYGINDDPITFWTNSLKERDEVNRRLNDFENKILSLASVQAIRSAASIGKEFISNKLLTADEILRYLDTTENIVTMQRKN